MFRQQLPRVYELRDEIKDPSSPTAYFQDFDNSLRDEPFPSKMQAFIALERVLKGLDLASWDGLKKKASLWLTKKDEEKGRGWQQLFNIVNEAHAYNYLRTIGCPNPHFIPPSLEKKTPDLEGVTDSVKVLCEVKTINISVEEVKTRQDIIARDMELQLAPGFFNKLTSDVKKAKAQLESYDPANEARHIVYVIVNFDDWVGEYKADYFEQIDRYLGENPITGIEIVFHNKKTPFHEKITMKFAGVFNE